MTLRHRGRGNEFSSDVRGVTMDNLKRSLAYGPIDRVVICKLNKAKSNLKFIVSPLQHI